MAELRRRVRAAEALQVKTRELAAANVLTTRETAKKAALAKDKADLAAREAAAAALRLFDDTELIAELLGIPAEDLEREAKPVPAARAKEVIESLRSHAERPRPRRSKPRRATASGVETSTDAPGEPGDGPADGA